METIDELIKEYLLFREIFDLESKNDRDKGFKAELVVEQLFSYINSSDINGLMEFWKYLDNRFFTQIDSRFCLTLKRMEISLLKYYIVVQLQKNKKDKILEFYNILGNELLGKHEWDHNWFAIPFIKKPETNPLFKIYFSKQWLETFTSSLTNFLNTIFQNITLPSLLNFNTDRYIRKAQECEIQALRNLIDNLKAELDASDNKITSLRQMLSQNYNPISEKDIKPINENLNDDLKINKSSETDESQQKKLSNKKSEDSDQINVLDPKINNEIIYEMKNLTESEHRIMMLNQDLIYTFPNKPTTIKFSTNMVNLCTDIKYSNNNNDYIYTILKNPNETNISLINLEEGIIEKVLYKEEISDTNGFLRINDNSSLLVYGNEEGLIRLFDLRIHKQVSKFEVNEPIVSLFIKNNDLVCINKEHISKWNINYSDNNNLSDLYIDKLQSSVSMKSLQSSSSSSLSLTNYPLSLQSKVKFNINSPIDSLLYKNIYINSNMKYLMLPNNEEKHLSIYNINNGEYEISSEKFTSDIECYDVNQNFTQSVVGCSDGSIYLNKWLYV